MRSASKGVFANGRMNTVEFSDTVIRSGKKSNRDRVYIKNSNNTWQHTVRGKPREFDAKIFENATDPMSLIFYVARVLDSGAGCNMSENSFMDRTGFLAEIIDRGQKSESGIKINKQKITEIRCDVAMRNRAGKVIKDYPFEHEFKKPKSGEKINANLVSIYYSKLGGDTFVPVFVRIRETPIGTIDIKLVKISKIK